jgi:filamentous hemagglutinin family protein
MLRRPIPLVAAALIAGLVIVLTAATVSAQQPAFTAKITLTGAAEVPGPGDLDATGEAKILIVPANGLVCWQLSWANVDGTVVAAHIHGPASVTEAAGVLVPLSVDPAKGCTRVDPVLATTIAGDPGNYYVNIHSVPLFGAGAIRGQLD